MQHENAVYIIALFMAGGITCLISLYAVIRHTRAGAVAFACLMLASTIYAFGYALELTNTTLLGMLFWIKVEYLGISVLPALWIIVVLQYVGKGQWLSPFRIALLLIIPAITLVLTYTNEYHHLYYGAVSVNKGGPFPLLLIKGGPWYWVQSAYFSTSFLIGSYLLLETWWRVKSSYRRQIVVMLAGSLVPWLSHIVYITGKSPYGLDLAPFTFMVSGLIFSWGLFRYQMLEIAPIARDIVFEGMRDGVLVLDTQNRVVDYNHTAQNIINNLSPARIGCSAQEVLKAYPNLLDQIFSDPDNQVELQIYRGDKRYYYNFRIWPIIDRRNLLLGKTIVLIDITEQVMLLEKLRTMATIDSLTGVFNRSHFIELCSKEIDRANRYGRAISLISMDLDLFKEINDTYGHEAGDYTLKAVADTCRNCLRHNDIFGRYGGEEFTICLPETSSDIALEVAERLRKKIAGLHLAVDNNEFTVTASFGIIGVQEAGDVELDDLLKKADQALYKSKEAGRNQVWNEHNV